MQGGGNGIVELARWAAAAAKTEPAARVAAMRPPWARNNYNGVHQRKDRYYAVIWNVHTARLLWLGSYATPEEAAYAYDAAARVTRGHKARPNFPAPAWPRAAPPAPAREQGSTELVLPLPARPARRDPAVEVAAQASFDNWLLAGSAAAAEPQHQQQGAPAAALFPHQHHQQRTKQNVQMSPTSPASTAQSSTEPEVDASQFLSAAAAPTHHRELPVSQAGVSDLSVVEDNSWMFTVTDDGASSSAAPPPVPRLTLDLLLQVGLPGRGGLGGAQ